MSLPEPAKTQPGFYTFTHTCDRAAHTIRCPASGGAAVSQEADGASHREAAAWPATRFRACCESRAGCLPLFSRFRFRPAADPSTDDRACAAAAGLPVAAGRSSCRRAGPCCGPGHRSSRRSPPGCGPVSSLARYMQTCRGKAMLLVRRLPWISAARAPNSWLTCSRISWIVMRRPGRARPCCRALPRRSAW